LAKDRDTNTAMGRAMKIRNSEINSPFPKMGGKCDGNTSSPNVKNMMICISHACPS
jgi:hypothetical protein